MTLTVPPTIAVGTARTFSAQPLANKAKRTIKNNFNFITISPLFVETRFIVSRNSIIKYFKLT